MFRKIMMLTVTVFLLALPMSTLADKGMDHSKMKDMDHSKMEGMDHGKMDHDGMKMGGDMQLIGSLVVEGVKARVHIKDVSKMMTKMGMKQTHHLMVSFVGEESGTVVEKGVAAVKIKNPDESEAKPVKLIGMEGHFGADLVLQEKGLYHFYIGTKLEDGVKRQFHFHTEIK